MDSREYAEEENTKINETFSSHLKEKVKELCKSSQEKHVLRMVLARSKVQTVRRLPDLSKNYRTSNYPIKKVLECDLPSDTTVNQKKQKIPALKMRSAPRERMKSPPPPSSLKSHKVKSQGFLAKNDPSKLISNQQKCNLQNKTALVSSSTPRNNLKTKHDFQNISSIKNCRTNAYMIDKIKVAENHFTSKVMKVPQNPVKIQKKPSKSYTVITDESRNDAKISAKRETDRSQRENKTTQEICKKSPMAKIPKLIIEPPIKTTKSALRVSELSPKSEILGRKSNFNPSHLTSFELGFGENGDKSTATLGTEDILNTFHQTCDDIFFDNTEINSKEKIKSEESKSPNIGKIPRPSRVKDYLNDGSSGEIANKVQKSSEWRRISSSYPSPVPEARHGSFGIIQEKSRTDLSPTSPNISTSKYLTPSSLMSGDSDSNLSVDDLSIEQVDAFKVNNSKKTRETFEKFSTGIPSYMANRSRGGHKNSPSKKGTGKSNSEPNKVLPQYQDACRSQTWLSFAKLFAENVKKARDQKKLRETDLERPVLNISGDAEYLPGNSVTEQL